MNISLVLLGGARRVSLAEQLIELTKRLSIDLEIYSIERDNNFYPISQYAKILAAPKFSEDSFYKFLDDLISNLENPLVVPCMDAAIPALSNIANSLKNRTKKIIVSTKEGAKIALDKKLTNQFCKENEILQPLSSESKAEANFSGQCIAKPLQGFGGRGISIFNSINDVNELLFQTHLVQQFIDGVETTHDLYISERGEIYASSRDRLGVIDGEVDHCIVRKPAIEEMNIFKKIAKTNHFFGPITVQTIKQQDKIYLIEINARLGGGVTASIAAGYPALEMLLYETFEINIPHRPFTPLEMKRARRDFYRILENS